MPEIKNSTCANVNILCEYMRVNAKGSVSRIDNGHTSEV
jgi:hypothetical protein